MVVWRTSFHCDLEKVETAIWGLPVSPWSRGPEHRAGGNKYTESMALSWGYYVKFGLDIYSHTYKWEGQMLRNNSDVAVR